MSGKPSDEIRKQNIHLPFLRKPFVRSVFRDKVRAVLNSPPAQPQEFWIAPAYAYAGMAFGVGMVTTGA